MFILDTLYLIIKIKNFKMYCQNFVISTNFNEMNFQLAPLAHLLCSFVLMLLPSIIKFQFKNNNSSDVL